MTAPAARLASDRARTLPSLLCARCHHDPRQVPGCRSNPQVLLRAAGGDERLHDRVRFGDERWTSERIGCCPACHVQRGRLHHLGCEWERCPECGMQTVDCPCTLAPFEVLLQRSAAPQAVRAYGMGFTRRQAQRMARRRLEQPRPSGRARRA